LYYHNTIISCANTFVNISNSTTTSTGVYQPAFVKFGYTVSNAGASATSITGAGNSASVIYNTHPDILKNALNSNNPILIRGLAKGESVGHVWVIDGYGTLNTYAEQFVNLSTKKMATVTLTMNSSLMVHCNLGFYGGANGWYFYGIFDTRNRTMIEESSDILDPSDFSENTMIWIPKKP
jgi:hypothetical protein